MQVIVSGQKMDVTPPLKEYIAEKIERVGRHLDYVTTTNVVLHVEKSRHLVEATISARGTTLHANAEADDMYAAIDALVDKLDRQVLKHKGKTTNHHRQPGGIKNQ